MKSSLTCFAYLICKIKLFKWRLRHALCVSLQTMTNRYIRCIRGFNNSQTRERTAAALKHIQLRAIILQPKIILVEYIISSPLKFILRNVQSDRRLVLFPHILGNYLKTNTNINVVPYVMQTSFPCSYW
jgi:hypothetical protein